MQLTLSSDRLPEIQALVKNLTARLEPYQYLHNMGLYTDLSLRQLAQKIAELEVDVSSIHSQQGSRQTGNLVKEVGNSVTHFTPCHQVALLSCRTYKVKNGGRDVCVFLY